VKNQEWFFWRMIFFHARTEDTSPEEFSMHSDSEFDLLLAPEASETEPLAAPTEEYETPAGRPAAKGPESEAADSVEVEFPANSPDDSHTVVPAPLRDVRPRLVLSDFAPNRATLQSAHIPLLVNLAREIVSRVGNACTVREIQIVGVCSSSQPSSRSVAESRATVVRAALAEAIERMWPGLGTKIPFATAARSASGSPTRFSRSAVKARAVEIFLELGARESPIAYPTIGRDSAGNSCWQAGAQSAATASEPDSKVPHESQLRTLSSGGFFYVLSTETAPSRWICSLEIALEPVDTQLTGDTPRSLTLRATGLLVSPRHVLTAAHCVFSRLRETGVEKETSTALEDGIFAAKSVVVIPGRNGEAQPLGTFTVADARRIRSSARWRVSRAANPASDFALLTLEQSLPTGFWGRPPFRILPLADEALQGSTVYSAGYPDRPAVAAGNESPLLSRMSPGSTQWSTLGTVKDTSSYVFFHDLPMLPGQDGAPIWIRKQNDRVLAGIMSVGDQAVRLTLPYLRQLRKWMVQDGVRPSF
jgi:V8-like Glu-specific endopeptidase